MGLAFYRGPTGNGFRKRNRLSWLPNQTFKCFQKKNEKEELFIVLDKKSHGDCFGMAK